MKPYFLQIKQGNNTVLVAIALPSLFNQNAEFDTKLVAVESFYQQTPKTVSTAIFDRKVDTATTISEMLNGQSKDSQS